MITTTLEQLLDAETALAVLEQLHLPVKTAYAVAKLTRLVTVETKLFKEQRDVLIKELGAERPTTQAEQDNGAGPTTTQVTPTNWDTYAARVTELGNVPVEIAWHPLTLAALEDVSEIDPCPKCGHERIRRVTWRPADLRRLGPLLVEDDPPTAAAPLPPLPLPQPTGGR